MTKEKVETPVDEHDRLKKREGTALLIIGYIALIGVAISLMGAVQAQFYENMKSYDFLTDDGIAFRDIHNATYTYEGFELDELRNEAHKATIIGIAILGAGGAAFFILVYINPANTSIKAHKIYCDTWEAPDPSDEAQLKYCPECGLKLSKLEKK